MLIDDKKLLFPHCQKISGSARSSRNNPKFRLSTRYCPNIHTDFMPALCHSLPDEGKRKPPHPSQGSFKLETDSSWTSME